MFQGQADVVLRGRDRQNRPPEFEPYEKNLFISLEVENILVQGIT